MASIEDRFARAVERNDIDELGEILNESAADFNVDQILPDGRTALHHAVRSRNAEMASLLVNHGADVFAKLDNGDTYLHLAVELDDLRLVDIFEPFIRWAEKNDNFVAPFEIALLNLRSNVGLHFIKYHQHYAPELQYFARTFDLYDAVLQKNLKYVKQLLELGADPNYIYRGGNTAFYGSFRFSSQQVMDLFLKHGADVNVKNNLGTNALFYAVALSESSEVVKRLLELGMNPNHVTDSGLTCAHAIWSNVAVQHSDELIDAKLKLLIDHGFDLNAVHDDRSGSVLFYAVLDKRIEVVKYLINAGSSVHGHGQFIPIRAALRLQDYAMIELLFNNGATIDSADKKGVKEINQLIDNFKDLKVRGKILRLAMERGSRFMSFLDQHYSRKALFGF